MAESSFDPKYKPVLHADVVVATIADGEVVVATADSSKALLLNESGAVVVSLCTGEYSIEQIASLFGETQGAAQEVAERDVRELLRQLQGEGLLA